MTLRVGIGAAPFRPEAVEFVRQAERLGVDSVWCPEFWAGDALHPARLPRRLARPRSSSAPGSRSSAPAHRRCSP